MECKKCGQQLTGNNLDMSAEMMWIAQEQMVDVKVKCCQCGTIHFGFIKCEDLAIEDHD